MTTLCGFFVDAIYAVVSCGLANLDNHTSKRPPTSSSSLSGGMRPAFARCRCWASLQSSSSSRCPLLLLPTTGNNFVGYGRIIQRGNSAKPSGCMHLRLVRATARCYCSISHTLVTQGNRSSSRCRSRKADTFFAASAHVTLAILVEGCWKARALKKSAELEGIIMELQHKLGSLKGAGSTKRPIRSFMAAEGNHHKE